MKASMVYTNYRYDLTGTGLKYLGEGRLNGQYIEKFRTNEMSVCRSCEPENGSDRLVISFSPFDGGCPDEAAILEIAEVLGLDRSIDYEIMTKPSFLCEKELVTYIIQTIPSPQGDVLNTGGDTMAVDRRKQERVYVRISTDFDKTGYMEPRAVMWDDGRTFKIDKVKDFRPANIYRDDCTGFCFTVMIRGEEKLLFFEPADSTFLSRIGRWYVMTLV